MPVKFDQTSPADIERFGRLLIGKTLRSQQGEVTIPVDVLESAHGTKGKGLFGKVLEKYYYGINPGNESAPDFLEAGVELKSTPLRRLMNGKLSAKERLVLNIINYEKEGSIENFSSSSFLKKNATIMLVSHEHENGRSPLDNPVRIAQIMRYEELPEKDRMIIENDWNTIVTKIRANRAHELSEGDTDYLAACTKANLAVTTRNQFGDAVKAKQRAFSLKGGYMTVIMRQMLEPEKALRDFKEVVSVETLSRNTMEGEILARFSPYLGKTLPEIHAMVENPPKTTTAKHYNALLARRILGIKTAKIEEFEKAEITMKTVQICANGMPKEDMSFPAFTFSELLEQEWESEDGSGQNRFRSGFENRFLIVAFRCENGCEKDDTKRLDRVFFWTMPQADIDRLQPVWNQMVEAVRNSNPKLFPKKSDSPIAHVRDHTSTAASVDTLPDGTQVAKRSFWLDKRYIKSILDSNN